MKKIKLIISIIMILAVMLCTAGCSGEFEPTGIVVYENINGLIYKYPIEDKATVKKIWGKLDGLECEEEATGKQGSSYYCFYFFNDKDTKSQAVFTIYDTGACCIADDFKTFYALPNGVSLYLDLEDICAPYRKNAQQVE